MRGLASAQLAVRGALPQADAVNTQKGFSMDTILTVRELTRRIRAGLEARFPFVRVRGEVSNLDENIHFLPFRIHSELEILQMILLFL